MHRRLLIPVAAIVAAGCASSGAATSAATRGGAAVSTPGAPAKWSGSFQPQKQRTSTGSTITNRAFGNVSLTPVANNTNRARVQITLTAQMQSGTSMAWGIFPGRCGSGSGLSMPLASTNSLPTLEAGNGNAQLDVEIPLTLPSSGTFHVNVFWSTRSTDLTDVLTCANLQAAN